MSKKKTSQQLREESRKLLRQAKTAELEEQAVLGRQLHELAVSAGKTPDETLEILKKELSQLSTDYPNPKSTEDRDLQATD